jgi:hypothetical protein
MSTPADQDPSATPEPSLSGNDKQEAQQNDAGETAQTDGAEASTLAGDAMNLISEHKGKLAIGVAATLGLMVYYGWREKRLAKTDPEEYALLQRLRAEMRSNAPQKPRGARKAGTKDAAASDATESQQREEGDPKPDPQ